MSNRKYSIDEQGNTITFLLDEDTGQQETFNLSDLAEAFHWLLKRQDELRFLLHKNMPVASIAQPMTLKNGFYVGRCADRRKVKVKESVWQATMAEAERVTRINWAFDINDRRNLERGPVHLVQYDKDGKEIPYQATEKVTPEDCPDFLIQEVIYKRMQAEWWVDKSDNLCLGEWDRWP